MKKEMKKVFAVTLISLIFLSLIVAVVHAADTSPVSQNAADATKGALAGLGDSVKAALSYLFGNVSDANVNKDILTKFFFAILLGMIIYSIAGTVFSRNKWTVWISTIIITLLAIIWLPVNFIQVIRDQYGVMGATILSVIPFIIVLVFSVRVGSALVGRVTWVFYVFYYLTFYAYEVYNTGKEWISAETIPYLGAIVAGLVVFLLIGPIRKALFWGEMAGIKESGKATIKKGKLLHKLQGEELEEVYGDNAGNR